MKVVVKNSLRDTFAFLMHLKKRDRLFKKAVVPEVPPAGPGPAPMNRLSARLHPRGQRLRITEVRQESPTTRTYRLEATTPDVAAGMMAKEATKTAAKAGREPAFFRAGQYIAVEEEVDGIPVSRPFSISSTPDEALEGKYYEITVKTGNTGTETGFFAPWSAREWKIGRILQCSEPMGTFYYEPLRDAGHLVCLAGGSGITPFRSILKDSLMHEPEVRCTLFYGATTPEELVFGEELTELEAEYPGRFTMIAVFSDTSAFSYPGVHPAALVNGVKAVESGFITAELIRKYVTRPEEAGFFLCGPPAMYDFLTGELEAFGLPPKRLRREVNGRPDDVPAEGRTHTLTVYMDGLAGQSGLAGQVGSAEPAEHAGQSGLEGGGRESLTVQARDSETVLVALERAGLNPPALCRSGECGWCRSRLISGEIHVPAENDGRRKADMKFRWFHPCSSYPRSDLTIEVPRNPLRFF